MRVVEQGALSDATTAVLRLTHSSGGRLVCLWLLGELDLDVPCAPLNAGKIDQPFPGGGLSRRSSREAPGYWKTSGSFSGRPKNVDRFCPAEIGVARSRTRYQTSPNIPRPTSGPVKW